jgi:hypothetical protein
VSSLFPAGVTSLGDLPYHLHDAIVMGLQYLRFEELPKDERPKRAIWLDQDRLRDHFDAVEKRRKEKYETGEDGQSKEIKDEVKNPAAAALVVE